MRRRKVASPKRANAWDGLPRDEMTRQQRVAADTNGYATVPNGITVAGLLGSIGGVYEAAYNHHPVLGAAIIVVSATADLADGKYARKYKVWGGVGESLDAGFDKIRILAGLGILAFAEIMPVAEAAPIAAVQVGITAVGAVAQKKEVLLHAGSSGKHGLFAASAAVGLDVGAEAVTAISTSPLAHDIASTFQVGGVIATVGAVGLGIQTLYEYSRQTFGDPESQVKDGPMLPTDF